MALPSSLRALPQRKLLNTALLTIFASPFFATSALAEHIDVPEIDVSSERYAPMPTLSNTAFDTSILQRLRVNTNDTASMLDNQPGISLYGAGGVSSLPAIHGLADDRVRLKVDGMDLISSCANHMNPPLSYIDPANVSQIKVFAGVTPVSMGGDSIAGTILVESAAPEFAQPGHDSLVKGRVGGYYRSNNDAVGGNVSATLANENLSVRYTGSAVDANNFHAAKRFKPSGQAAWGRGWLDGDEVGSSAYEAQNHQLALAARHENHLVDLKLGWQNIPYQGFPNQRMDMTDNDSKQINARYTGTFDWGQLQAAAYHERTRHSMQFGDDKLYWYGMAHNVAGMPMDTEGRNTGGSLKADVLLNARDLLRVGAEYQRYRLDDWWDPVANSMMMAPPNAFININNGQRDRYDVYGEWEANWSQQWLSQLGLRSSTVKMDAGRVHGYSTTMMANYGIAAARFNNADRSETDQNWDATAALRFTPDATQTYEAGYAMKTRSPNLYERYTWSNTNSMVMNMNNWYGDGNGYVGNLNLDPEKAHTVSVAANWHDAGKREWQLRVAPYYTYVQDYIDAVPCLSVYATCPTRTDGFVNLSLDNQSARLYGVDISGQMLLAENTGVGSFTATGVINYVRGKNRDTGDDLYNIMPLNATLALQHRYGQWNNVLQAKLVTSKDHVQAVRKEMQTAGYGIVNFYTSYSWQHARLDLGIENLFDKDYDNPLGGAYIGQGNTMESGATAPKHGTQVPGMGRSLNVGLTVNF
ncbi:MAG TPA: TonB-dependent receptor [Methylophilus sp.]|nr:TonB-dependent receptor [Methylophilus sp.]